MTKTEIFKSWVILLQFVFIVGYLSLHDCSRQSNEEPIDRKPIAKSIEASKAKILQGKEEIASADQDVKKADEKVARKIKKAKTYTYPISFDSSATMLTVKKALAMADTAVRYWRDTVVAAQREAIQERDTTIAKRDSTLNEYARLDLLQEQDKSNLEKEAKQNKRQVRKQKLRRWLATGGGGLAVAGGAVMLFNPVTGVILVATGGTILVISAIKGHGE